MILQVTNVKYLHDYQLWLRFYDHNAGGCSLGTRWLILIIFSHATYFPGLKLGCYC